MPKSLTPRQSERMSIELAATCRTGTGLRDRGFISDISATGCRLKTHVVLLKAGASIVIRPDGMEGLGATVRWVQGTTMGLEFQTPLYQPVLEHLLVRYGAGRSIDYLHA